MVWLPIILLIVSFITFALGRFGPGDPVEVLMGQYADPEVIERIGTVSLKVMFLVDRPFRSGSWRLPWACSWPCF